jgi:GNAT superfamily N-acetyltransferase
MQHMTSELSDLVIRATGEADVAAIAELRTLWTSDSEPDPDFAQRMRAWLAAEAERRTTWLAVAADRPLGMVSLFEYQRMPKPGRADSRWGYVGNLFVCEDSRNRGIGSALLAEVIATAEERSYARLVVSASSDALSLFHRAGFALPARTHDADVLLVRPATQQRP